ncbi:hypothetical protein BN2497_6185 [Janthinobacterium sp. CG23_2]|nr:hypothetical protein BN2497_6185 [Janthinobacterium sp. CG23_2]CUU29490.1 hypothetical protein BN3177_6185 [Janthinobacterium sp. CG23_2]
MGVGVKCIFHNSNENIVMHTLPLLSALVLATAGLSALASLEWQVDKGGLAVVDEQSSLAEGVYNKGR